ncbi:hypothetical protein PVK06_027253 [Gossypium arboreum]|uniref:Putative plant transposon protein domain-containing protein n=1 Tax=Gossypium arboreum TaxID=29729 RepID=A0ABR0P2C2_GOSAR|nr:hypothetical protein PVK06_027253 [Gossypium arboreum]
MHTVCNYPAPADHLACYLAPHQLQLQRSTGLLARNCASHVVSSPNPRVTPGCVTPWPYSTHPLIMPHKRTHACAQIDETQNKFHCEEAKARYESIFKNQQMHPEKGFTLKESNYKDFMARIRQVVEAFNLELFCEKRPSVDEELVRKFDDELVREFYVNLTSSELTKVPVCGIKVPITSNSINEFFELPGFENYDYSSLMSNIEPENLQEILEELTVLGSKWTVSKQGIHTCRREYLTPLANLLIEESKDLEEEEEDPIEIEPMQSAEVPDKVEPMEPKVEPDDRTSIFRAQPPSPNLRDELSKLMDIMQHMQWQQQAYWRY